jgi:hypothetical protein
MAKTNSGLLAYAKAQVGLPYWYGTFGQVATEDLYTYKKKQYPRFYTAKDFPSQYGQRVHDCVGIIKGYIWSDSATATPKYVASQDRSADGMYYVATKKGEMDTFPGTVGILVFKTGDGTPDGISHVGVYDGNGYVYEAKGHAYGVVKTAFKASAWKFWAQCPYTVDDAVATPKEEPKVEVKEEVKTEGVKTVKMELDVLKRGATGDQVKAVQRMLYSLGYDIGYTRVDGSFGSKTEGAIRRYQHNNGLEVDGVVGTKTWTKLLKG